MPIVATPPAVVKIIFRPEFTRKLANPYFGFGVAPERVHRQPYGSRDLEFAAGPMPTDATSDSESRAFLERTTLDVISYVNAPGRGGSRHARNAGA
jgi:hypothetical protein